MSELASNPKAYEIAKKEKLHPIPNYITLPKWFINCFKL